MLKSGERKDLLAELQRHPDRLPKMTAAQTVELEKSEEVLEQRVRFEYLISDLT
jgi:hypothetical protein